MAKKKQKNLLMIIGVVIAIFFLMRFAGREAKTDFTRTFSSHDVRPGDTITVTYTAVGMGPDDFWIGELPLPASFDFVKPDITRTDMELTTEHAVRFYGEGSSSLQFYIIPTERGQYTLDGFVYHPRDDATYVWCAAGCDYVSDIISSDCVTKDEVVNSLRDWLLDTITTSDMVDILRSWMTNKC